MRIIIRNDEPEGSPATLVAVVVTTQDGGPQEDCHKVPAGQQISIDLAENQFVMLDDKEN